MEKRVTGVEVDFAHVPRIRIRQQCFAAMFIPDRAQSFNQNLPCFIPGNPLKFAFSLFPYSLLRKQHPIIRLNFIVISSDFFAKKFLHEENFFEKKPLNVVNSETEEINYNFETFFSSLISENILLHNENTTFYFQNAKLPERFGRLKLIKHF